MVAHAEDRNCLQGHPALCVTVPGRTELAGNHQDHQGGMVIAAAVDRRITCEVYILDDRVLQVESEGQEPFSLDLDAADMTMPRPGERYSTRALVRGMASQVLQLGVTIPGCRLVFRSDIPVGFGLSSSAAFELCTGAALLAVAGVPEGRVSPMCLAQMALRSEREFFGKPCGIMDQVACCFGGVLLMDFEDRVNPKTLPIALSPSFEDYAYVLVKCPSGHADASEDYASVAHDMEDVARVLGVACLRDLDMGEYLVQFSRIRERLGYLAALRGLAFYEELMLVKQRLSALERDDMHSFIELTLKSSACSAELLQNVYVQGGDEGALTTLAICRAVLDDIARGAEANNSTRIHGGGFGGTIQAMMPRELLGEFEQRVEDLLGHGCCMPMRLGAEGVRVSEGSAHAAC